ncbi:malonyl-CoA/methylmalonyl-CoA synthetase [Aquamicrobium terrae]
MKFNIATMLTEARRFWPRQTMVQCADAAFDYEAIDERTARVAEGLRRAGFAPGARIVIHLPNIIEFIIAYFGALHTGLVVVPLNPMLTPDELTHLMLDAEAVAAITAYRTVVEAVGNEPRLGHVVIYAVDEMADAGGLPRFAALEATDPGDRQVAQVDGDATAIIIYTSGTTGQPKGAELSHLQVYVSCTAESELLDIGQDDVTLAVLPLFHVFGLSSVLNIAVRRGETIYLMRRFDAQEMVDAIHRHRLTVLPGVPTMFIEMLAADWSKADLSSVRIIVSGGAPMPVEVIHQIEQRLPQVSYVEGWGMSESAGSGTINGGVFERRVGSIGRAVWGVEIRAVDEADNALPPGRDNVGEMVMRGHNIMKGYLNRPDATAETVRNGWLHTGDLAWRDEDGYFYIVGRVKELIIRGGYNVYARDVEEVIHEIPGIVEAVVVGRPDERLGEEVVAFVVLSRSSDVSEAQVIDHCRSRLAAYKYPREVRVVADLPRGPTGKVRKDLLMRQALGVADAQDAF